MCEMSFFFFFQEMSPLTNETTLTPKSSDIRLKPSEKLNHVLQNHHELAQKMLILTKHFKYLSLTKRFNETKPRLQGTSASEKYL